MAFPQPSAGFTNNTPLTLEDFMERPNPATGALYTREEAEHKVRQLVFGHDYLIGADGQPVEQGKGSPSQQTSQHKIAVAKELERQLLANPMHF
jgi:hypothetical protein